MGGGTFAHPAWIEGITPSHRIKPGNPMSKGVILMYDSDNGIGLIIASGSGEELPFHRKDIVIDIGGSSVINAGQEVVFEIREGQDGRQATNIQPA